MPLQEMFDSIMHCIERLVYAGESDIPQALARESGFNRCIWAMPFIAVDK